MSRNQIFATDVADAPRRAALGRRPNVSLSPYDLSKGDNIRRRLPFSPPTLLLRGVALLVTALAPFPAPAEPPRPITLRQAIGIALEQNPDVLLARLNAEKAGYAAREARAPFSPQLVVGSGLAATSGIPQSVEGASPSIVRAVGRQFLYNREQSSRVKQARELAVAAEHVVASRQDEVAFRVASTYLDFERSWRRSRLLRDQAESLARVERVVAARVAEGRAIPLTERRARLDAAKADRALETEQAQARVFEATLRHELGLGRDSRLEPAPSDFVQIAKLPESPLAARNLALDHNPELKKLDADLRANGYALRAEKGSLFPRIDLVTQYSLLGRFNNFEDFFNKFQRHNGQFGISVQVPVFGRRQAGARAGKVRVEARRLGVRRKAVESGLDLEITRLYEDWELAISSQALSHDELDFTREKLSVELARFDEGLIAMEEIERARLEESRTWGAYYDSQYAVQKAKLNLLRQTGQLAAAVR